MKELHLLGAVVAFFVGLVYFWVQAWISYFSPSRDRRWVVPLRVIFCSLCTCMVICMFVLNGAGFRSESAMCEWALVMGFFALFGLFAAEFRHIDFHKLTVQKQGIKAATDVDGVWTIQQIH